MRAHDDGLKTLHKLIKEIRIAMMTTMDGTGHLHSRPMATIESETFVGELWFFTQGSSPKVSEMDKDQHVNLSYASPKDQRYASLSGTVRLVRDAEKIEKLWSPLFRAWFPLGLKDPELALLKVTVDMAEYWDAPPATVVRLVGLAKALATGKRYEPGDNRKLTIQPTSFSP
jgi:general stress protein 26